MKTIKQTEQISFHAVTLKSALIMLPLMDELVQTINRNRLVDFYKKLPIEVQDKYQKVWTKGHIDLEPKTWEQILALLSEIGFESQLNLTDPSVELLEPKN